MYSVYDPFVYIVPRAPQHRIATIVDNKHRVCKTCKMESPSRYSILPNQQHNTYVSHSAGIGNTCSVNLC